MKSELFDPNKEGQLTAGVQKKLDGTVDYSKAAYVLESDEILKKRNEHTRQEEERKAQKRKDRIIIPSSVKPGTGEMVSRALDISLFLNKEALAKQKEAGMPTKGIEDLVKKQQLQLNVCYEILGNYARKLREGGMDSEQAEEESNNLSATEVAELIRKDIDKLEVLRDKGTEYVKWYGATDSMPIGEVVKIIEGLEQKLFQEAPRFNRKEEYGRDDITDLEAEKIDQLRSKLNPEQQK